MPAAWRSTFHLKNGTGIYLSYFNSRVPACTMAFDIYDEHYEETCVIGTDAPELLSGSTRLPYASSLDKGTPS